ncbi:SDR family NAD(P)-dependent oxidoreductase [Rhizobium sp. CG5]|uniref:SDR family NAD(P)-dependent oxidoreductase n=1 Tax=Rhizobium sp. CG5 TaxID=2726076 RepID=UPI002033470D|nr:SDR family NAD(P)-dependent oxidoreductase [Rhizobium sp. CG5]MCM2477160.1 SDR family NAD(P)-dependent oxidoreductase [Rhizobium sp. CG5]
MTGSHVIISGGSSGIGLALAAIYLSNGNRVTLIGRSAERLRNAADRLQATQASSAARLHLKAVDVSDAAALATAIHDAEAAFGPCDILITSAGIVTPGFLETLDAHAAREQIDTNLIGTINATQAVYAGMRQRGRGTILLVSSAAALIGIPGYATYCASKAGLTGFAEALRMEAEPAGIHVAICYPPDTDTPQLAGELAHRPPEAEIIMGHVKPWPADKVAARIVRGLDQGRHEIFFGLTLHLLARFGSLVKPILTWWFLRRMRR